ncbi:hypothetical protein MTO96_035161 [Rhipicephalus appendiculatus]
MFVDILRNMRREAEPVVQLLAQLVALAVVPLVASQEVSVQVVCPPVQVALESGQMVSESEQVVSELEEEVHLRQAAPVGQVAPYLAALAGALGPAED